MKFQKADTTPRIEKTVAKSVNFEVTIADIARRSERRAWFVAFSAIVMSLILAGGYFYFLPLKEKVPYLVMADAYTGTSTVARLRGDFNDLSITKSEAINRSNIAHFILARESYDQALLNLRDWRTVFTMSEPDVAAAYSNLLSRKNPASPLNLYKMDRAIRVRILSITPIGGSQSWTSGGATVRFQCSVYDKASATSEPLDSKIATLQFTYKDNLSMDEEDRIENPLGFRVMSYRVENDYAASPPLEMQALQVPTMPAAPNFESQMPTPAVPGTPPQGTAVPPGPTSAMPAPGTPTGPAPAAAGAAPPGNPAPAPSAATPDNTNGARVR